jgi:hypothetical protein
VRKRKRVVSTGSFSAVNSGYGRRDEESSPQQESSVKVLFKVEDEKKMKNGMKEEAGREEEKGVEVGTEAVKQQILTPPMQTG